MNRFAYTTVIALTVLSRSFAGAQSGVRTGCYRAGRALGTSTSATEGPNLHTFRLLDSGKVDRPGAGRLWPSGSRWSVNGDTLMVVLSTRLSGWRLRLTSAGRSDSLFVGEALYLTDVIVVGPDSAQHRPPRVPVRVVREACS